MHVVRLLAPRSTARITRRTSISRATGIRARWQAGYADTKRMLKRAPWKRPVDPIEGVVIHDPV